MDDLNIDRGGGKITEQQQRRWRREQVSDLPPIAGHYHPV